MANIPRRDWVGRIAAQLAQQYQQCFERYDYDCEKFKSVSVVDNQALLQLDVKGTLRQTSVVGHRAAQGEAAIGTNQEWHEAPRRKADSRLVGLATATVGMVQRGALGVDC